MKIKTSAIVYGIRYIRRFGLRTLIIRIIEKKREKDSEYQSFYLETKASLEQLHKATRRELRRITARTAFPVRQKQDSSAFSQAFYPTSYQ